MTTGTAAIEPARQIKRRRFLTTGPEEPFFNADLVEYLERFEAFVEAAGVPGERVLATPVVAFPLPVAVRDEETGSVERWSGVKPEMMWHPLFWLPPRIALRYQYRTIDDATGGTSDDVEIESDETWAVRVALEMVACGLYSPSTGTWLDVLAYYGLDTDDPVDLARVQMWQDGHADPILDTIDLSHLVDHNENRDWAFEAAKGYAEKMVPAQWSLTATGIIKATADQLALKGETDSARRETLFALGRLAISSLRSIPADETVGISVVDVLTAIVEQNDLADSDSAYLMDEFLKALSDVAEDFEPYLLAFSAAAADHEAA